MQAYVSSTRHAEAGYQELSKADGAAQHTIAQQTQRLRVLQVWSMACQSVRRWLHGAP